MTVEELITKLQALSEEDKKKDVTLSLHGEYGDARSVVIDSHYKDIIISYQAEKR